MVLLQLTGSDSYSDFRSCIAINPWDTRRTAAAFHQVGAFLVNICVIIVDSIRSQGSDDERRGSSMEGNLPLFIFRSIN